MATLTTTYASLHNDISRRQLKPVYILHGPECYFIDRLTEEFSNLIAEEDRDFNLYSIYGSQQLDPASIIETCRRYPMMADRQVVILKEAQSMRADQLEKLTPYVQTPTDTTVLVICFRGAEPKGRTLVTAVKKVGEVFESKRLKESAVISAIAEIAKDRRLGIEPKAQFMLCDYVGTDLAKIHSAIGKLAMILPAGATITPESIERNIGISKDYNNFELTDAIVTRNFAKAMQIVSYFKANPKPNPTVMVTASLFSHFANLLIYHFTPDKSERSLMSALGLRSPWQLKGYQSSARNYNAYQTIEIISELRRFDARSKGVGSRMNDYDMLRDLIYFIITARGNIAI